MASGPITSWQIDGETVSDFIFGGSKITADGDCSHEIKRRLFLGRKVMTNLDSILKSRDIANKGPSSQSYGFSSSHVWVWELDCEESWALKNWRLWTVVLEKTLESPLINQSKRKSVLNIHRKDWCWSWNSNTLATSCEGLTHWKTLWCWEGLGAGGEGDDRGWDGWISLQSKGLSRVFCNTSTSHKWLNAGVKNENVYVCGKGKIRTNMGIN